MKTLALVGFTALLAAGCINLRAGYDNTAWNQCMRDPDESARRACTDGVADHSREQRRRDGGG